MVAALRSLLAATALLAVFSTTAFAQDPACDRTWNGTTGDWGDATRWSGGAVPNGNERGCLPGGSYTVTVSGGTSPKGVTVGAGVTVLIKQFQGFNGAGSFINHGTVRLEQNATLNGPLTNDGTVEDTGTIPAGNNRPNLNGSIVNSGTIRANQGLNFNRQDGTVQSTGKLETAGAGALINGTGFPAGTWTISGTVANAGTMQFQAGTMQVRAITTQSGNPLRTYQSKLDLTGATGTVEAMQTVDLITDIPAAATVRVTARTDDANLRLDADRTNNGALVFDSTDPNRSTSLSNVSAAARLTNAGTLRVTGTTGPDRFIRIPITNTAAGTMTVDAGNRMVFAIDAGETITAGTWNINGNVWVQGGGVTTASRITQTGGAITVAGGVSLFFTGGRFTHQGGTTSGEIQLQNNSTLDASGPGAATYHVLGVVTLAGNVNAAATINVEASGGQPAQLALAAPSTMAGRITFTTGGANAQDTEVNGGQRLTVTGRIDVLRGQGGTRHFKVPLTIAAGGQFNVEALSTALLDGNDTFAHQIAGSLTVAGGAYFGVRSGTQTVTQTGGTIDGAGAFSFENLNTFVHQAGTIPGELALQNGSLLDASGPGAATYHVVGSVTLAGDVNAAATVNGVADGGNAYPVITLNADRTVAGTLNLTSVNAAQDARVTSPNGSRLTISGTLNAKRGVGGIRHLDLPLTVTATGTFALDASSTAYVNGDGSARENRLSGTVTVPGSATLLWRIAGQTVRQLAGTITGTGQFVVEGNVFKHEGGSVVGQVTVSSSNVRGQLDASGPGTAAYVIVNSVNLIGDVSVDADIEVGTSTGSGALYVNTRDVTNRGSIQVGPEQSQYPSILSDEGQPYTLTNAGSLTTGSVGSRNLDVRMINTGTLTINAYTSGISAIENQPLLTNNGGTVTVMAAFSTWRGYTQTSGLTDLVNGSIGSPRTVAPTTIDIKGGRLRGTGTLYGPVVNAGTVEVGRSGTFGKLEIKDVIDQIVRVAASYTQTATGHLLADIGGTTAGTGFDQLTVDGPAALGGALDLSTKAGYTPVPNVDKYRVVLGETRTGTFADLSGSRLYTGVADATGYQLTARVPPPPSSEVSIADATVVEGAGPLTFTVKLSKASTDISTVDWTTEDDSALAGADYTASSGTVTFPAGSLTQTITVPVVNDAVVEPLKDVLVRLRHPVNATLDVATATGHIAPDDVGITSVAPTRVGDSGPATIGVTGGGFAAGTTVKLTRAGQSDRVGTIVAGPDRQSKFNAKFDLREAAQGTWTLVVTTPSGATTTSQISVEHGQPSLHAVLTVPGALRYGWVGRATLSLRNGGLNDVGIDAVRFVGSDLELRAVGATTFSARATLSGSDLGDALVIPALSTRTVAVEVRSTTTVGHAYMGVDAEIFPAGYLSQTIAGSDPDPGTGSITGHVTNASGQPVRDLRVTAFDGTNSASAKTDGSGAYALKPLKPGSYTVTAGGAKGSTAVNENARTVDLVTGVADLSGSVSKADAIVALLRDGQAVANTAADATGGFRFRVTKAGAYTLVADSPTSGRASRAVTVAAGVDQPGLNLTLGTRTLVVTTTAGATVKAWPAGEQDLPSTRVATAGGTATFNGMPPGALAVTARAAGKAPATVTGVTANAVTVTLPNAVAIGGRVTSAGTPVKSALVVASAGGAQRFATTGADGRYSIADLAAGNYDVWVMAPGAAPLVKRAVTAGTTTADAAVIKTGGTLDVKVGTGVVGRLISVVDPATGVTVAAGGTVGPDAVAHFGPLPAGSYEVRGAGAGSQLVTVGGGGAKAARAEALETVTLDDDGYPVVADPEPDPAYEEYTSPFSGLKAPQLNEKDRLGWDQIFADYPGPCPTADRIYDTIQLKQKAKLLAFSAWVDAWDAIDTQNRADIERLMTLSAQWAANSFLALATLGEAPDGMSYAAAGLLGNVANYIGTMAQSKTGLLDPLSAADYAQYLKDAADTVLAFAAEAGSTIEFNYLSSVINVLRGMTDLSDKVREFPGEVAARANGYIEAQDRYERLIREINDLLHTYDEAKKHCPEQVDRGPKPPVISGGRIENITSNDPNEILGPVGSGAQKWIPRSQALAYAIRFENLGPGSTIPPGQQPASAPATVVKVVTTLSPSVNVDDVTLGGVGWGAVELGVPGGLTSYHKDVPQADGDIVRVDGALNKTTRTITWTLKTIDPETGEIDGSPTAGFLPPEDGTRRGQGHVDYLAGTPDTVAQGTAIAAKATITFDVNTPIETNTHTNTVDGAVPAATLTLGDPSCDGKIPVNWNGTDVGSGVASYTVEVSEDGASTWKPWLAGVTATSGTYAGVPGRTYAFRVMARDAVGNEEAAPAAADATKTLGPCDLLPPRTTATVPGGAVGGWYGGPVDIKLDAVDAPGGSGVAALRYGGTEVAGATATAKVAAEGVTDLVFSARDVKGNVEADAHLPVRIDTTPPAITATDGASYAVGQAVAPDVSCADAGSGIASCVFPGTLDTAAAGPHSFTVNAADKLGHTASRTFAYTVVAATQQGGPPPGGSGSPKPAVFGSAPVKVKLGKITRTTAQVKLTSAEKFAFTGKATLQTSGKKPKAQAKAVSFSLAVGKTGTITLKLNAAGKKALKGGKKVKLVLRLELKSGTAKKTVDVKVTLRAAR